jgi:predicted glycosyltransferase
MRKPRVFFHVQHLLGIGHLRRAAILTRALREAGFEVTLASGGMPVEGIDVLQLPPASSADLKQLLDEHGKPVDEAWKARRRDALLDAFRRCAPDVLLVELFPFGRRQLRFELLPLLDSAKGKALIVCSVRDLLQPRPAREAEVLECFEHYFDRLLVHGDPRVAGFERSFGSAARLAGRVHYTGYVAEEQAAEGDAGSDEVLVSAGGGAVGGRLLEAALQARPLCALRAKTWRILAGVNFQGLDALQARAGDGVVIERFRNDFTLRLRNCVLSVSQAGYNTVVETLQARARAVLVPFAAGGEVEQTARARLLEERGLVQVVDEAVLSPATLAAAIDRAAAAPRPAPGAVDLGGAQASAALLRKWLA